MSHKELWDENHNNTDKNNNYQYSEIENNNNFQNNKVLNGKSKFILDGAIGDYLTKNYGYKDKDTWTLLYNSADHENKLIDCHLNYLIAGVDIITTNTFRTNPLALEKYNNMKTSSLLNCPEEVLRSVKIAKKSIDIFNNNYGNNKNILIAGSNPPAEDSFSKRNISYEKLKDNHLIHINNLYKSGVDFILNETISGMDEIEIISKLVFNSNIPSAISLMFRSYINKDNKDILIENQTDNNNFNSLNNNYENTLTHRLLIDDFDLNNALQYLDSFQFEFISLNCISQFNFFKFIEDSKDNFPVKNNKFGFYYNNYFKECMNWEKALKITKKFNPIVIGGCCGVYPEDIKDLIKFID